MNVVSIALVLAAFLGIFLSVELLYRKGSLLAELARKIQHLACGGIVSCFPWIFTRASEEGMLALLMGTSLYFSKKTGLLTSTHAVARRSFGEFYFLGAALLLFLIGSHAHPLFYFIGMLTLTLSDAFAALVGTKYSQYPYLVNQNTKSLEGSLVFFVTTFLTVQLPLLLFSGLGNVESILIAFQIALVVTALEALSTRGMDNFLIPFSVYYLLIKFSTDTKEILFQEIGVQLAMIAAAHLIVRRFRILDFAGILAIQLFLYGSYTLDGAFAIVSPILCLAIFVLVVHRLRQDHLFEEMFSFQDLIGVMAFPFLSLVTFKILHHHFPSWMAAYRELFLFDLFLGALSANLGIVLYRLHMVAYPGKQQAPLHGYFFQILSWGITVPPVLLLKAGDVTLFDLFNTLFFGLLAQSLFLWTPFQRGSRKQLECGTIAGIAIFCLSLFRWAG